MTNLSIVTQVNEIMHSGFEIPLEKLSPEAHLFSDLGLDSLDAVDMLVHLEDQLGVKVDGEKLMQVRTMQDVYNLIQELTVAQA
jgi:acyl carrier protein